MFLHGKLRDPLRGCGGAPSRAQKGEGRPAFRPCSGQLYYRLNGSGAGWEQELNQMDDGAGSESMQQSLGL